MGNLINIKIGNDNGNSEQDIIINGVQICQPNVMAKVRKLPMLDEVNKEYVIKNIQDNLIVTVDSPSAAPGIYFIGKYAMGSGERVRSIEVGTDNDKSSSDIVIINTLAQISGYAVKEFYSNNLYSNNKELNEDIEDIKVNVEMTTALPISQYSKKKALDFAERFMKGKHKVTVHVGTTRVNVEITFTFVKVIPEGVTVTHAVQDTSMIEDIFIDVPKDYFKNKKILHVAVGEGTTELPVTNGIEFNPNFIRGLNNGIGHAIDRSLDEFKKEFNLLNYTRQKYSEVLRDTSHKFYPAAHDIIQDYIEEEAEDILHAVKEEIQKANNEIDIILVYGGGSIPMREILESKLKTVCEKGDIELFYVPEKYAVIFESIGLYKFCTGPIFKFLSDNNRKQEK